MSNSSSRNHSNRSSGKNQKRSTRGGGGGAAGTGDSNYVMVHLHLKFNKLDKTYLPDEEVKCEWQVSLSHPIKLRCLYVRYRGDVRVKWSETGTVEKDGGAKKHTEYLTYHDDANYFKHYVTLYGKRNGKQSNPLSPATSILLLRDCCVTYTVDSFHFLTCLLSFFFCTLLLLLRILMV